MAPSRTRGGGSPPRDLPCWCQSLQVDNFFFDFPRTPSISEYLNLRFPPYISKFAIILILPNTSARFWAPSVALLFGVVHLFGLTPRHKPPMPYSCSCKVCCLVFLRPNELANASQQMEVLQNPTTMRGGWGFIGCVMGAYFHLDLSFGSMGVARNSACTSH